MFGKTARCLHLILLNQMVNTTQLNNGECISQGRNADIRIFPTLASLCTRQRARCINTSDHFPLEVHTSSETAVSLTNSKCTSVHLQAVTKPAYGITIKEEIKKWSSCSIWVEDCVLLREGGYEGLLIKNCPLSNSCTFLLYLCNTSYTTAQHSAIISWSRSLGDCIPFLHA